MNARTNDRARVMAAFPRAELRRTYPSDNRFPVTYCVFDGERMLSSGWCYRSDRAWRQATWHIENDRPRTRR